MRSIAGIMLAVMFMLLWLLPCGVAQAGVDEEQIRANIIALDRIKSSVMERKGAKSGPEDEQRLFLAFLESRIAEECAQLRQQGISASGLPCPAMTAQLPRATATTSAEQVAALDRELQDLLGEFDEMLLAEQDRVARREQAAGGGGGAQGAAGGQAGAGNQGDRQGGASANGTAAEQQGGDRQGAARTGQQPGVDQQHDGRRETAAAAGQGQQGGNLKNGAPPGHDRLAADDDIVARQLREAAEKEKDPELKKKLWQEYRRYKEGR